MSLKERIAYWKMAAFLKAKALGKHLPKAQENIKDIVLVAGLPRSGTTLLHTYLNSHRQVQSFGYHEPREVDFVLEKCQESYAPFIRYALFKVLLSPEEPAFLSKMLEALQAEGFKVELVLIERENLLRNYVSLKLAEQNQQWSAWRQKEVLRGLDKKQVCVSPQEAKAYILSCQSLYGQIKQSHLPYTLSYEHLVEQKDKTLYGLQNHLGLRPQKLESLLKKQNPEPLKDLIANWEDFDGWST